MSVDLKGDSLGQGVRVTLLESDGGVLCHALVSPCPPHGLWAGTFEGLSETRAELFCRFDEIVSGQALSLLDAVEAEVASLGVRARFEGEPGTSAVGDLQIYPSAHRLSFRYSRVSPVDRMKNSAVDPSGAGELPTGTEGSR